MSTSPEAQAGYRWCRQLARDHYENFPVASLLLPGYLRGPVAAIYAFARTADDIADESDLSQAERHRQLDQMTAALHAIESGAVPDDPMFQALADTIKQHALPIELFHDLLGAFSQDIDKQRYQNFGELMDYCRRSANPVGRLLLHLQNAVSESNLGLSDAICSALQLINFLQDIAQDARENNRIYLPLDELQRFGVDESDLLNTRPTPAARSLVQFQVQRASKLLRSGSLLGTRLSGRFGLEIRAIVLGGARILEKLHMQENPFSRPRLEKPDRLKIVWGALRRGFP